MVGIRWAPWERRSMCRCQYVRNLPDAQSPLGGVARGKETPPGWLSEYAAPPRTHAIHQPISVPSVTVPHTARLPCACFPYVPTVAMVGMRGRTVSPENRASPATRCRVPRISLGLLSPCPRVGLQHCLNLWTGTKAAARDGGSI